MADVEVLSVVLPAMPTVNMVVVALRMVIVDLQLITVWLPMVARMDAQAHNLHQPPRLLPQLQQAAHPLHLQLKNQ
ncbi:hypothetical protein QC760_003646 [Botrytis cinerea]